MRVGLCKNTGRLICPDNQKRTNGCTIAKVAQPFGVKYRKQIYSLSILEFFFPNISQPKTLVEAIAPTIMRVLKFDI
jgi:hypothetical protein